MKRSLVVAGIVATIMLAVGSGGRIAPAEETGKPIDAAALVKGIPVLTERDEKLENLTVKMTMQMNKDPGLRTETTYAKPNKCVVTYYDLKNEVPIATMMEGRTLLFDPVKQAMVVMRSRTGGALQLRSEPGKGTNLYCGVFTGEMEKAGEPRIRVDIASVLANGETKLEAVEADGKVVVSTTTDTGALVRVELVPGKAYPCSKMSVAYKREDGGEDIFLAMEIAANRDGFQGADGPDIEVLKKRLKVIGEDTDDPGVLAFIKGLTNMATTMKNIVAVRMAADTPEGRAEAEKTWKQKIDWEGVKEFDRKAAEAWKEAMAAGKAGGEKK